MNGRTRGAIIAAALCSLLAATALAQARQTRPILASYRLSPGWATFGLVLPRGAAREAVQVGGLPTQTDVKTTWPDGSIRFAVVTVRADRNGTFPVTPAEPSGPAAVTPAPSDPPQTAVRFVIGGRIWTALLPQASDDAWLAGPLVRETRSVVAPIDSSGRRHAFLRVIFDVRTYASGGRRIDVTVENTLNVPEADRVRYDVTVQVAGSTVFEREGVSHGYLARWRKVFAVGLAESRVTPDFEPFIAAGAVPRYLRSIDAPAYRTDGPSFDILNVGSLRLPMNDVGGRPEIAPYPNWTAQYLVHRRPDELAYMLAHGDLAGSFGIHLKEPDGRRLVSIDAHPDFWLDRRADDGNKPPNDLRGQAFEGDVAHQPSLAYVPYLVTGDRYYADEMKYWANFCLIRTWQDPHDNRRRGSQGLLVFANDVRGIGWGLRNMGDTVYLPDADPEKGYLLAKVRNNLDWLEQYARTFRTPLGTLFTGYRPEDESRPPYAWIALWEHTYVAWALDHLQGQGLTAGTAVRDRVARFQLDLFSSEAEGFRRLYAGPGRLAIGVRDGKSVTYFTSLKEVFSASFGTPPESARPFTGYYGPEARLMLLIALEQGWAGARDAYHFLMSSYVAPDHSIMQEDLNERSGWAIAPAAGGKAEASGWQ